LNQTFLLGNDTYDADSNQATVLKQLLGIKVDIPAQTKVGANCSPLNVLAVGGGSSWYVIVISPILYEFNRPMITFCSTHQPVCCTGNDFSKFSIQGCKIMLIVAFSPSAEGLVVIGCSPININL
jgi:hypothetical protein